MQRIGAASRTVRCVRTACHTRGNAARAGYPHTLQRLSPSNLRHLFSRRSHAGPTPHMRQVETSTHDSAVASGSRTMRSRSGPDSTGWPVKKLANPNTTRMPRRRFRLGARMYLGTNHSTAQSGASDDDARPSTTSTCAPTAGSANARANTAMPRPHAYISTRKAAAPGLRVTVLGVRMSAPRADDRAVNHTVPFTQDHRLKRPLPPAAAFAAGPASARTGVRPTPRAPRRRSRTTAGRRDA